MAQAAGETGWGEKIWVNAPFRVYASIADSLRVRTAFLKNIPVYTTAGLFVPGTVGDLAKEAAVLKKGGYATDEEYVQKLNDVWNGRTIKRTEDRYHAGSEGALDSARGEGIRSKGQAHCW